ncbi:MAG: tRNA (guanosine(37)-N1)-methyltransferase TrmD [Proteobacteria bacterium]|nr:tRNA (guanosine(37)-N1)-methyltransferase TrmD [Pseudomonadota bacterium]MBQ4359274.1 tRNA (guanosine(37)-N1)-methyltransferase TrmD [Pseudomonadota bacterium]
MGHVCFVSLFPEYFEASMGCSILGRAVKSGHLSWDFVQIRDFSHDKHHRVDDTPYGGGAGLVMKPDPVVEAIEFARQRHPDGRVVLMSPQGRRFDQGEAGRLSAFQTLIFVCGHYEGLDERILNFVDEEISLGDFVLTGGELAAQAVCDAVCRLWPGVLGNDDSSVDESFSEGWLEYPQYTRPVDFRGLRVPDILLSGNHGAVDTWRRLESIKRTRERRPDLFEKLKHTLSTKEKRLLGISDGQKVAKSGATQSLPETTPSGTNAPEVKN